MSFLGLLRLRLVGGKDNEIEISIRVVSENWQTTNYWGADFWQAEPLREIGNSFLWGGYLSRVLRH